MENVKKKGKTDKLLKIQPGNDIKEKKSLEDMNILYTYDTHSFFPVVTVSSSRHVCKTTRLLYHTLIAITSLKKHPSILSYI